MKRIITLILGLMLVICLSSCGAGTGTDAGSTDVEAENAKNTLSLDTAVGDTVVFGAYEQDADESNGAEDIEWLVLDKAEDRVLLISKYILDKKPYNEEKENVTWEKCSLREWLNNDFYESAFNQDEKNIIAVTNLENKGNGETKGGKDTDDRIFLLSMYEVKNYLPTAEERACIRTSYAVNQSENLDMTGGCTWWLRTPGTSQVYASMVTTEGYIAGKEDSYLAGGDVSCAAGVRPALWINLNA
jgi:hypothetical protein